MRLCGIFGMELADALGLRAELVWKRREIYLGESEFRLCVGLSKLVGFRREIELMT